MEGECVSFPGSSSAPNRGPRRTSEEARGALEGTVEPLSQSCSRPLRGKAPGTALCHQPSLDPCSSATGSDSRRGVQLKSTWQCLEGLLGNTGLAKNPFGFFCNINIWASPVLP